MTVTPAPQRGTRPANRRALIVAAATELFFVRGYEHVAMGDIAEAVAVGPSALYRHFASKQLLLEEVVLHGLGVVRDVVEALDPGDPHRSLRSLTDLTVQNRHIGILVEREARHLSPAAHARVRAGVLDLARRAAGAVETLRPDLHADARDLAAWMTLGVVVSPSFHQSDLTAGEQAALLADLSSRIIGAAFPADLAIGPPVAEPVGLEPRSRREALLQKAIELFAEGRYAGVGIEDVAAALGMAGPSVYNHFSSKTELLATALFRGAGFLYMQVADVLAVSSHAAEALRGLIASYVEFALTHPALVDILITEVRNLPESDREAALAAQRDYIAEWVHLVCQSQPQLPESAARLQVHAVLTLVNYVARVRHLRSATNVRAVVVSVCQHLLGVSAHESRA